MDLKAKQKQVKQLGAVLVLMVAIVKAAAANEKVALPGCNETCGDIKIPYPFGIGISSASGNNCFLEEKFNLTCNASTSNLYMGENIQVLNISLEGWMEVSFYVSKLCIGDPDGEANIPYLQIPSFPISSNEENKFITIGCDSIGYLNSIYNGRTYSTGCLTRCYGPYGNDLAGLLKINEEHCTGVGCCQVDIPPGMKNITVQVKRLPKPDPIGQGNAERSSVSSEPMEGNSCGYSFVAKRGSYKFSIDRLKKNLPNETFPLVVDWTVGNHTCEDAMSRDGYACKKNSFCDDKDTDNGYRCRCKQGYQGNPYHPRGCTDVDECKTSNHSCISELNCLNTDGSYICFCPKGHSGNGTVGVGCQRQEILTTVVIGVSSSLGSIVLLFLWWLYKVVRKRVEKKRKDKFFKKHGGLLLQQRLSSGEASGEASIDRTILFSLKDLERATDNFNMNRVLGKGGQGTVYKGMLVDGKIVAVKKLKVQGNVEEFINEFVVLSQINHRNVVKLLGCCLETEIPLLVYEFIPNGTLFEYLHDKNENLPITWDMRLRIAIEIAGALFYLHSVASQPIYHRDIKSTNILLDEKYRAKVADFGTSRIVSMEATHLTTVVQGTFGYLDPEYFHTSQFTEKSDVYSFGVVLAELLTGQKPISLVSSEKSKNLASYFALSMEDNRLFDIIDKTVAREGEKEYVIGVANLAYKCLELNGKNRPTMKEVTMELERIRGLDRMSNAHEQHHEEIELAKNDDHQPFHGCSTSNTFPSPSKGALS